MGIEELTKETTAADIMVTDIVSVLPDCELAEAARLMLAREISGLPVVDAERTCVGVISASDMLRAEEVVAKERQKVASSNYFNSNLALPVSVYAARLEAVRDKIAPASEQPVRKYMTGQLITVSLQTPLIGVIDSMVSMCVHRVLVLDQTGHLQGIVSTMDVLKAVLRFGR